MQIAVDAPSAKVLIVKSLSYVVIVGGLTFALAGGARWLVSAEPGAKASAYTPVLPPRIADSIERKKELPPPPPAAVPVKPFVAQPALQQATVSLHPPRAEVRDLRGSKPRRTHAKPAQPQDAQPRPPVAAPEQAMVTTARSDVPY